MKSSLLDSWLTPLSIHTVFYNSIRCCKLSFENYSNRNRWPKVIVQFDNNNKNNNNEKRDKNLKGQTNVIWYVLRSTGSVSVVCDSCWRLWSARGWYSKYNKCDVPHIWIFSTRAYTYACTHALTHACTHTHTHIHTLHTRTPTNTHAHLSKSLVP